MPTIRCGEVITEICGSALLAPKKKGAEWRPQKMDSAKLRLALSFPSVDEFGDQAENQNDHDPGRKGVQKVPQQQHLRLLMVEISIPCP
jgi:hypothetical protein